jgi:hypothetical protein
MAGASVFATGTAGPSGINESLLFSRIAEWQRSTRNLGRTCGVKAAVVEYLGGSGTISRVECGLSLSTGRQVMRQQEPGLDGPRGPLELIQHLPGEP